MAAAATEFVASESADCEVDVTAAELAGGC